MATAFKAPPVKFIHPDDMPDQYALTGIGVCMEPVISDRALVVFDKREQPQPGDTVGLIFTPEYGQRFGFPGFIKRLSSALPPREVWDWPGASGLIFVEQLNPPRSYTFLTSDVLAVHKCVGLAEPDGDGKAQWNPKQECPR